MAHHFFLGVEESGISIIFLFKSSLHEVDLVVILYVLIQVSKNHKD